MTQNDTLDLNDVRRLIEEAEASLLMGGDLDELGEALATLERLGLRVREKAKTARLERKRLTGDPDRARLKDQRRSWDRCAHGVALMHSRIRSEMFEQKLFARLSGVLGSPARVHALDAVILTLIVAVLVLLGIEYTCEISDSTQLVLDCVDTAICLVFLSELSLKLACSESRSWFLKRYWLDLIASIPFAGILRIGRALRAVRIVRLVRVVRVVVFVRSRFRRIVEESRDLLDREYALSFDTVCEFLEQLGRRPDVAEGGGRRDRKWMLWFVGHLERSWILRALDRVTRGWLRSRAERKQSGATAAAAMPRGIGGRLAKSLRGIQAALHYVCDFNGVVTTPQLLNYTGQTLFNAGKRRGIVLLAFGAAGAAFGYVIQAAFVPPPRRNDIAIDVSGRPQSRIVTFGPVVCDGKGGVVGPCRIRLVNSAKGRPGRPFRVSAVALQGKGAFRCENVPQLPLDVPPGESRSVRVTFDPTEDGEYANVLIIRDAEGRKLAIGLRGSGDDSIAHRVARRSQESFGFNFVLISLPFLVVALIGWQWASRSKRLTEDYRNVAEASFINLMEDAKKQTLFRDLGWLYDRVLKSEVELGADRERALPREQSAAEKAERLLSERRQACPSYETADLAYDPAIFPHDDHTGAFSPEELADTRTGFVLEAMHILSRGKPGAAIHNRAAAATIQLYRDYLDGALFHETDRKTIEQLLGNTTIRRAQDVVGYTSKDTARLRALAGSFGPNLWLTFINRSIAEQTGRLVSDYNRSAIPQHTLLRGRDRTDPELLAAYERWIGGGRPVPRQEFLTHEFTALHFLVADEQQDERVRDLFGERVLERLIADRTRLARAVFGTYPLKARAAVNPYRLYRRWFGRSVAEELQMGRLRRAVRLPKSVFKWIALPLRLLLWAVRAVRLTYRAVKRFLLNILADVQTEEERGDYDAALRKITRMRGPVIAEATALRSRFDFDYLGCSLVGRPDRPRPNACVEDLRSIGASDADVAACIARQGEWRERAQGLDAFMHAQGLADLSPEVLRAVQTAFLVDREGLQTYVRAQPVIAQARATLDAGPITWPRGTRRRVLWNTVKRWLLLGHDSASITFTAYCDLVGDALNGDAKKRLRRMYLADLDGLRTAIDAVVHSDGSPEERARQIIDGIRHGGYDEWTAQLITVRTVHALSLLDRRNYELAVYRLGRFDELGVPEPAS